MFVFRSIIFHNRLDLLKMKGQIMDKKIIVLLSGCILAVFLLAGCGNDEVSSEYNIEYLNKDKTKIVDVPYEPEASDTDGMIKEFLAKLSSDSDNVEYRKPIPNGVEVTDYSLDGVMLSIHFDADYSSMTEVEEVLCRAAVVLTMTQIPGVDCVSFYVADAPLTDIRGNIVGSMNQDSFIENPGEQINSIQCTTLKLYFANETGDGLVEETRSDVYMTGKTSKSSTVRTSGSRKEPTAITASAAACPTAFCSRWACRSGGGTCSSPRSSAPCSPGHGTAPPAAGQSTTGGDSRAVQSGWNTPPG